MCSYYYYIVPAFTPSALFSFFGTLFFAGQLMREVSTKVAHVLRRQHAKCQSRAQAFHSAANVAAANAAAAAAANAAAANSSAAAASLPSAATATAAGAEDGASSASQGAEKPKGPGDDRRADVVSTMKAISSGYFWPNRFF